MPDFDLTGELSLKIELHMLRPITEKSTQWQWASFVSAISIPWLHQEWHWPKINRDLSTHKWQETLGLICCKCFIRSIYGQPMMMMWHDLVWVLNKLTQMHITCDFTWLVTSWNNSNVSKSQCHFVCRCLAHNSHLIGFKHTVLPVLWLNHPIRPLWNPCGI